MTRSTQQRPFTTVFGAFGIYRYVLAVMVVINHTAPQKWWFVGSCAVYGFFILSGYVVSFTLHYNYLPSRHGFRNYVINRGLRIYPQYWLVCVASSFVLLHYPIHATRIHLHFALPESLGAWVASFSTFTMINPLTGIWRQNLVLPVGWSLGIEIFYWLVMPRLLRQRRIWLLLFCFAAFYTLLVAIVAEPHPARDYVRWSYFSVWPASLPFCIGLMLFRRKLHGSWIIPRGVGILVLLSFLAFPVAMPLIFREPRYWGFYFSIAMNTLLIGYLGQIDHESLHSVLRWIDTRLGNLSYPLFLVHMPVGVLLLAIFPTLTPRSMTLCMATIVASSVVAATLHVWVQTPLNRLRLRIKRSSPEHPALTGVASGRPVS